MNRSQFQTALGTVLLAPTLFALVGPNVADLRTQASDTEKRKHLRHGQYVGTATVLGVGLVGGVILPNEDKYLLIGSVVGAIIMWSVYEYALRTPIPDTQTPAQQVPQTFSYGG